MDISVIVPTFNCQRTISECLKSIFNSTYKNFEVIVVDDYSSDSTIEKIKKFDCKIISLKKNNGVANARNIGAKNAKTNFLIFVDSDILVHKDTISKLITAYRSNPEMKTIGANRSEKSLSDNFGAKFLATKIYFDYKWKQNETYREFSSIQSECCFIEKKAFEKVGGFNIEYKNVGIEEYELAYRFANNGYKNYIFRDILYEHYEKNLHNRTLELLRRTPLYLQLFLKKKRFESDGAVATRFEAFMSFFSFLGLITTLLTLISIKLIIIPAFFLIIIVIANLKFFLYLKKKTWLFILIIFNFIPNISISRNWFRNWFRNYKINI